MMEPNPVLAKKLHRVSILISIAVLILVVLMRTPNKIDLGISFHFLPPFHAIVNTLTAITLIIAFTKIKQKNVEAHRKSIYIAMGLSLVFLLSYVLYHFTTPETKFGGEGWVRGLYFFFLLTHILLAAITLPFILFTFVNAYTNQIDKHRRLARWVFPLWLYVAVTGPICYLMLMPYYSR